METKEFYKIDAELEKTLRKSVLFREAEIGCGVIIWMILEKAHNQRHNIIGGTELEFIRLLPKLIEQIEQDEEQALALSMWYSVGSGNSLDRALYFWYFIYNVIREVDQKAASEWLELCSTLDAEREIQISEKLSKMLEAIRPCCFLYNKGHNRNQVVGNKIMGVEMSLALETFREVV